jgi:hypothetical protein
VWRHRGERGPQSRHQRAHGLPTLGQAAPGTYTVQFFSGNGKVYLGYASVTITIDDKGTTGYQVFSSSISLTSGDWVTATATDAQGNTSELAQPAQVYDLYP